MQAAFTEDNRNFPKTELLLQLPVRLLVAPRRSGSTMMVDLLSNARHFLVSSRVISKSIITTENALTPDYSVITDIRHPLRQQAIHRQSCCLIVKEETGDSLQRGNTIINECNIDFTPSQEYIHITRPAFLFRNPLRTFDSWLALGWSDIDAFVVAYRNVWEQLKRARSLGLGFVIVYESIVGNELHRREKMKALCQYWQVPFDENILTLPSDALSSFAFISKREKDIFNKNINGIFSSLKNNRRICGDLPSHNLIKSWHVERLMEAGLTKMYDDVVKSSTDDMGRHYE